jgi:hypothetical protein
VETAEHQYHGYISCMGCVSHLSLLHILQERKQQLISDPLPAGEETAINICSISCRRGKAINICPYPAEEETATNIRSISCRRGNSN